MSDNAMPVGKIGSLTISRLIIGGNQFSGWSHSRDLKYLRDLFKAYATEKNILQTLRLAEENGINTIISGDWTYLTKYWKDWGGRMQWIAQVHPKTDDMTTNIKRAIDGGAVAAYVHGGIGDSFVQGGRVDLLGQAIDFIKSNHVLAGIGGHSLEVPKAVEKAGIRPDFYIKTFHHDQYWSATPKEQRVEFIVDSNGPQDHDNIWCIAPEKDIEFMRTVVRPWIAYKVLAAGAIHPRDGFKFAFDNGADFICVGMFDFQVRENVIIAREAVAQAQNRQRPWRA
jgi:hypothetical protein